MVTVVNPNSVRNAVTISPRLFRYTLSRVNTISISAALLMKQGVVGDDRQGDWRQPSVIFRDVAQQNTAVQTDHRSLAALTPFRRGRSARCAPYIGFRSAPTLVRDAGVSLLRRQRLELRYRPQQDGAAGELVDRLSQCRRDRDLTLARYFCCSHRCLEVKPK